MSILFFILSYVIIRGVMRMGKELGEDTLWVWMLGVLFAVVGAFLLKKSKQIGLKKQSLIIDSDDRAPILYLRSFKDDPTASLSENSGLIAKFLSFGVPQNLNSEEEQMAMACTEFGPFMAIGDPRERIPQLGASRIYPENASWKAVVLDVMRKAQLVILRVGDTPGFWWEVHTVLKIKNPKKIIFLLPDDPHRYRKFSAAMKTKFSLELPANFQSRQIRGQSFSAVLSFDRNWSSSIIYCKEHANSLFHNGVAKDFNILLKNVFNRAKTDATERFKDIRTKPERTFLAKVQRIGGVVILGLILASIIRVIIEEITDATAMEMGSPAMLGAWFGCSVVLYLFIALGERLGDDEQ